MHLLRGLLNRLFRRLGSEAAWLSATPGQHEQNGGPRFGLATHHKYGTVGMLGYSRLRCEAGQRHHEPL